MIALNPELQWLKKYAECRITSQCDQFTRVNSSDLGWIGLYTMRGGWVLGCGWLTTWTKRETEQSSFIRVIPFKTAWATAASILQRDTVSSHKILLFRNYKSKGTTAAKGRNRLSRSRHLLPLTKLAVQTKLLRPKYCFGLRSKL